MSAKYTWEVKTQARREKEGDRKREKESCSDTRE